MKSKICFDGHMPIFYGEICFPLLTATRVSYASPARHAVVGETVTLHMKAAQFTGVPEGN